MGIKLIAHRGNTNGPTLFENQPEYIEKAIENGFDVEVDVWSVNYQIWLGHDAPQYKIKSSWLYQYREKLWIHAKNFEALDYLFDKHNSDYYNVFWIENDKYTITSAGYIWCHHLSTIENNNINGRYIYLNFDKLYWPDIPTHIHGVCGDYVGMLK